MAAVERRSGRENGKKRWADAEKQKHMNPKSLTTLWPLADASVLLYLLDA